MRFKFTLFLIFTLYNGLSGHAQNMLINPSAESPLSTGWVIVSQGTACDNGSNWRIPHSQAGYPAAQLGGYFFFPGCSGVAGTEYETYQDVDVTSNATRIDSWEYSVTFSGYSQSFAQAPPDETRMVVEYRNAANNAVLTSYSTGNTATQSTWTLYSDTRKAPPGTRYIRVRLIATHRAGSAIDSYFDALSLTSLITLPVKLLSFSVQNVNRLNQLSWTTADEIDNKGFRIEKSRNGQSWQNLGWVAASVGQTAVRQYTFTDSTILAGENYYRLVQVDIDGTEVYSPIKTITTGTSNKVGVFPVPATDRLYLTNLPVGSRIKIISSTGVMLGSYPAQPSVNIKEFKPGLYFVIIEDLNTRQQLKFMKQ